MSVARPAQSARHTRHERAHPRLPHSRTAPEMAVRRPRLASRRIIQLLIARRRALCCTAWTARRSTRKSRVSASEDHARRSAKCFSDAAARRPALARCALSIWNSVCLCHRRRRIAVCWKSIISMVLTILWPRASGKKPRSKSC